MKVARQSMANSENRVVVGLGSTGLSCARFLYRKKLPFTVVDTRVEPPGLAELRREMSDVQVFTGEYPTELITAATELIVSPGIAMDASIVTQALTVGVDVVGDIDLFMREAEVPVVGITGSNAKSTVTELFGEMARAAGRNVGVGGNLGIPALELLAPDRDLYVLELSSFQLERADSLGLSVATVLNISADHMDRHGTMSGYQLAKHRIFRGCKKVVVNQDDPLTVPLMATDVEVVSWRMGSPEAGGFGLREKDSQQYLSFDGNFLLPTSELTLFGRHNIANALAALALGYSAGLSMTDMISTLRTFKGLPHRCEQVAEIGGVRYVNDSKGTNVGATAAALRGLGGERDILLIAGGQGKGADFSPLQQPVLQHCKQLLLIGEDASVLQQALFEFAPVHMASSMEEAFAMAASQAEPGDTVLLSPACASFDMFSGYIERGESFCALVNQLSEDSL
jgi:UDP-N-acetylmuramoylalanine--D-glutamate ligase